jgi:hypothetical protein
MVERLQHISLVYDLRVESWVLQDENDDSIFELGEHIMVRNIMGVIKPEGDLTRRPRSLHMDEAVKLIGITSMINRPVPNFQLISPFVV